MLLKDIMRNEKLPTILVLTSVNPHKGPAVVAETAYQAFLHQGFDVDFMCPYPVDGHPEYLHIYNGKKNKFGLLFHPIVLMTKMCNRILKQMGMRQQQSGYYFFYRKETNPPIPVKHVINSIRKSYDVVFVVFWQGMLSFQTIEAIYDKFDSQFYFWCVDYSPMSGGCHFIGDCQKYVTGCGACPAIYSKNEKDFTHFNVEYRKQVYEKVKPIVMGNTYIMRFYDRSYLLKDYDRKMRCLPLVDNNMYSPRNKIFVRQKYKIPENKKFLIFFGSQSLNDERKGIRYLLKALSILYDRLNNEERNNILLILAGRNIESIKDKLCFDYNYLGYVNPIDLPDIYSMSDVFLSPSVNDAGPTMVNQSMACGTPVVAFDMGTAIDVIKGYNTGYCAELRNAEDFAYGIEQIFKMFPEEYQAMCNDCRQLSLSLTSEKAFCDNFLKYYYKYKK